MSLNDCLDNIRNFINAPASSAPDDIFRVTVVAFEDRCNLNCGMRFAELLKRNPMFGVDFFGEPFPKAFLNLQGRNFFDFIDQGKRILETNHSDIVIWGYEENGKIRLNFQTSTQYVIPNDLPFSLLDSVFVPLNYFSDTDRFPSSLLLLIYGIIVAAINPVTNEQKQNQPRILAEIVKLLAADTSQKDISREFMPFIMNMLVKVYLNNTKNNLNTTDIEIMENMLNSALKNEQYMRLPIYFGCLYNTFGQLYETAFLQRLPNYFAYLKSAVKYYRQAQKYFGRNYPYDYALLSFNIARLNFEFWKHTEDIQALRDAVSQLRETEKIYTADQFPQSWCYLEGLLGYYLSCLGMKTQSNDIMLLAINSYHKQQKIYEQSRYSAQWAAIQEEIGNIYYLLGKQNQDINFILEACNYFNSAIEVYTQSKDKKAADNARQRLAKAQNYID